MIFVTVGTHEQPFNRLVEYMDKWAEKHDEEVIIQTGYSTYKPVNSKWKKLYSYNEMNELFKEARIVITHGGPSSFIIPIQLGKIPIVVPRKKEFNEHVNDHQLTFCKQVAERMEIICMIENVEELSGAIDQYDVVASKLGKKFGSNNARFCKKLADIVEEIMN